MLLAKILLSSWDFSYIFFSYIEKSIGPKDSLDSMTGSSLIFRPLGLYKAYGSVSIVFTYYYISIY